VTNSKLRKHPLPAPLLQTERAEFPFWVQKAPPHLGREKQDSVLGDAS
jgi:hypothetical protein